VALRAVVVGGGIGGIAAAVGLARAGLDVQVHEQAQQLTEVGAGVSLAPNGLRMLERLGVGGGADRAALMRRARHSPARAGHREVSAHRRGGHHGPAAPAACAIETAPLLTRTPCPWPDFPKRWTSSAAARESRFKSRPVTEAPALPRRPQHRLERARRVAPGSPSTTSPSILSRPRRVGGGGARGRAGARRVCRAGDPDRAADHLDRPGRAARRGPRDRPGRAESRSKYMRSSPIRDMTLVCLGWPSSPSA
jgi:hypothetical protein